MKIKEMKIQGLKHSVVSLPDPAGKLKNHLGRCDIFASKVEIRDDMNPQQQRRTLLHESLHAVDHQMGLNLNESQIQRLASGIDCLLLDNPEFVNLYKEDENGRAY